MQQDTHKTKVIFRVLQGEVFALFPELPGTYDPSTCTCYAHIGQHSTANLDVVTSYGRLATPEEYTSLYKELTEQFGYNLDVRKRATYKDYQTRMKTIQYPLNNI